MAPDCFSTEADPLALAICLDFAEKMLLEASRWCSWGRVKVAFSFPYILRHKPYDF
jgi:hypothetical protein